MEEGLLIQDAEISSDDDLRISSHFGSEVNYEETKQDSNKNDQQKKTVIAKDVKILVSFLGMVPPKKKAEESKED